MFDLIHICSQYGLLELLAQNLSTMDLYHTALTCSKLYDLILRSPKGFERLTRVALCDGSGLAARQTYEDLWRYYDPQEIEVKVWNTRCDETVGLPCLKCGVNVCEECRVYPRVGDRVYGPCRRPHFTTTYEMYNIICYCDACDEAVESRVGKELCKCDRYTRWLCRPCHIREDREASWVYKQCTKFEEGWDGEEGMVLDDHQHQRAVSYQHLTDLRFLAGLYTNYASSIDAHVVSELPKWAISGVCGARRNTRL